MSDMLMEFITNQAQLNLRKKNRTAVLTAPITKIILVKRLKKFKKSIMIQKYLLMSTTTTLTIKTTLRILIILPVMVAGAMLQKM